ncbi:MAG: methylmalonyl Co-A mutase-associated GTPase MeaB [Proteobacteria bacterium]|nr:methylmalonyl Co-A mutase-associated GTPase MeaB [Pseudomonadota bacterium]NDC25461.1 methylmalonyl Co-A mutase-associated GTPase MeaB [Pseudomonadota bacterium]NDD05268.1 methylmalonyl Co-A mutase-associated GTPase MeaB [Pseudomonadota bacterium]NDG26566.1 methylmalonyl Co-A mutase-associated GTPase MeaB [Pseudomonadota bacterium]
MSLMKQFQQGDLRALARLISLSEDGDSSIMDLLSDVFLLPGHAKVIGITGPPGAGKSTLLNSFVRVLRGEKKKVAVLAVDPVSPFSGGALLGDRIRLTDHFNDPDVFIRSLSTRGKLGGLSLATRQGVTLLDRFGFDYIFVETVGVGQSEVDIRKVADVTLVTLVPEWGDSIQALKSGILEIADIFVVNKSDREGADRIETELRNIMQIANKEDTPIQKTTINDQTTVQSLLDIIENYLAKNQLKVQQRRNSAIGDTAVELLDNWVIKEAKNWLQKELKGSSNPYEIIKRFQKKHPPGSLFSE